MTTTAKDTQVKIAELDKELLDIEAQIEALEQKKADRLKSSVQYVQSGKSFRALEYSHTDIVNGKLARINALGPRIDAAGKEVVRQPRKNATTRKPAKKN